MSIFSWITFFLCAALVLFHWLTVGDARFLLFAIPGLAMLLAIPLALNWMSRRSFREASSEYRSRARSVKIGKIGTDMVGDTVKITGRVRRVSFRWLNRPHFLVEDGPHSIRVIMFTNPDENIKEGDDVEALGIVMKNLFSRKTPVISAVSVGILKVGNKQEERHGLKRS